MTNEGITIRMATQQDREALCNIQRSAILTLGRSHYSEAELEAWSSGLTPERYEKMIADHHVVIAERGSQVVAFGRLESSGEVGAVYVRPGCERQGIGNAVLAELLSEARQSGLRAVYCKSSLCAEAFYSHAGFQSAEKCKHQFRDGREIECVPMTMTLD
jgi:putative acetyltransferase